MYDQVGVVAEFTKCFREKSQVSVPKQGLRPNGQIGIKQDFQGQGPRTQNPNTLPLPNPFASGPS